MKIPEHARYGRTIKLSCEFLESYNVSHFPVDPFSIIESEKWGLITYSELATNSKCSIKDVIISLRSEDGLTTYNDENFTIAYNDTKPKRRILFTLFHEIGHIYLNHLTDFEKTQLYRGSLSKAENTVLENEVNAFARNVLAPAVFVVQLKVKTKENLSKYFGISHPAAQTRLELLDTDFNLAAHLGIQLRLVRLFYMYQNRYGCKDCGATIFIKKHNYCPVCGKKKLRWGEGNMIYTQLETHENGKLKKCSHCYNEETNIKGDFCQICGSSLINRCIDDNCDSKVLPSNYRYCPECGGITSFYRDGLLQDWEVEYKAKLEDDEIESKIMYIPDGIDEELPFN